METSDLVKCGLALVLLGIEVLLCYGLYSIVMLMVSGASAFNLGTVILGGILLWFFGGLLVLGIIAVAVAFGFLLFGD